MHSVLFNFPFLCKHGQCAYLCIWAYSVNLCLRLCVTSLCCVCSPVSKDRTVDQCAVLAQRRDHRSAMCSILTHVRLMMKSDKSLDRLFSSLCLLHWRHVLIALFRFTKKNMMANIITKHQASFEVNSWQLSAWHGEVLYWSPRKLTVSHQLHACCSVTALTFRGKEVSWWPKLFFL